jgi:hypothetical protein
VNTPLALCVAAACALVTWSCESAPRKAAAERAPAPSEDFTTVRGVVIDTLDRPVPYATVIGPCGSEAIANAQGCFEFSATERESGFFARKRGFADSDLGYAATGTERLRLVLTPEVEVRVRFAHTPDSADFEPVVFGATLSGAHVTATVRAQNGMAVVHGLGPGWNLLRVVRSEHTQLVAYDVLIDLEPGASIELEFRRGRHAPAQLPPIPLSHGDHGECALLPTFPNLSWFATESRAVESGATVEQRHEQMRSFVPRLFFGLPGVCDEARDLHSVRCDPPAPGSYAVITCDLNAASFFEYGFERVEAVSPPR